MTRREASGRAKALALLAALSALALASPARAALPPVPVPRENPITEPKRVLGKILFWDEQLSVDSTVACGTCHRPAKGGGDPREGVYPGKDGVFGTDDDSFGSPGVTRLNREGVAVKHALFGMKPQIGNRTAPNNFGGIWGPTQFWDGRAGPTVTDPLTGKVVIATGGALEDQVLGPLMNPAEMAKEGLVWPEVVAKLQTARPLALASNVPPDMAAAVAARPSYGQLFTAAFGDPAITPVRIAFALATYERTLVPDQTPYDLGTKPGQPIDPQIQQGLLWMDTAHCTVCHKPPLFTDNLFHNIGVRRAFLDQGRAAVANDATPGAMKTPSLRNAGLRTHFMHTGEFHALREVVDHYVTPKADADPLPGTREPYKVPIADNVREQIIDFITDALVDPRVAAETFPFDRPTLRSERQATPPPGRPGGFTARFIAPGIVSLAWTAPPGGASDYVLLRDGATIGLPTGAHFTDIGLSGWRRHGYRLMARNDAGQTSPAAGTGLGFPTFSLAVAAALTAAALMGWRRLRRRRRAA